MKRLICLLLAFITLIILCACGTPVQKENVETWTFTDSCGREVEIPVEIDSIAPSGSLAQIVLYTICPDKLQSFASALTKTQKKYIDEKYYDLPVTGQFYGGGSTVNYEEIIASAPDIIIDVGQEMENIADDMDEIQARTGIPTVFIEAGMGTMAEAYETLGEITGEAAQAEACAAYIRGTISEVEGLTSQLAESERKRVLYAQGEYGTEVLGVGSIHAEILEYAAAVNVAELAALSSDGSNEVSMEQILLWDPEVVILAPDANYKEIFDDAVWRNVRAVRDGEIYEIPIGPYNWLDRPPSVQRILGLKWLVNLLYPDVFAYDMIEEAQEFYRLFFHYELTAEEAAELMAHSTYKEG